MRTKTTTQIKKAVEQSTTKSLISPFCNVNKNKKYVTSTQINVTVVFIHILSRTSTVTLLHKGGLRHQIKRPSFSKRHENIAVELKSVHTEYILQRSKYYWQKEARVFTEAANYSVYRPVYHNIYC